jgi:hypothetical protein
MPFIDSFPPITAGPTTASSLTFILDLIPVESEITHSLWLPRILVDGVEVQIRGAVRYNEDANTLGSSLSITLLKDDDRALFTGLASIDFGIGRTIAGLWDELTFQTLLKGGSVDSVNYNIQGDANHLADAVSVTIVSNDTNRLNRTSETGLVIYDSDRVTISDADMTPIKDAGDNLYAPAITAIPGMTLGDLFQKIFINECDFEQVFTNLPADDYPLQRYQVQMGQRFYDGLKGFIGMYSPAISLVDNAIWILDTTLPQPVGFPEPKEITIDRPLATSSQKAQQSLDGLLVQYVGLENNYDYTTFRFDYPKNTSGNVRIESEVITIEFRKKTATGSIVVREAVNIENRRSFLLDSFDYEVDNTSETVEFTSNGYPAHIRKVTQKRLPPITNPTLPPTLQNVLTETEEYAYAAHPFKRLTQYVARRSYHSEGIISYDDEDTLPDGSTYKRDLMTSQRSGNVKPISSKYTFVTGNIKTREETTQPLRNGNVRIREYEVDEMSGLVVVDKMSERTGDVGISGVSSTQEQLLALAPGAVARSSNRIEDFPVGELPLAYALPLAERVIAQRQAGAGTVSIPVIGFDASLKRGVAIKVGDRDGNSLGNFIITGRTLDIDASGLIMTLSGRAIVGSNAPLQQIPSFTRTIAPLEVMLCTIPVVCTNGYSMRVKQGSISDVTVEARHVGDAFVNIETTELFLAPWAGSTQNFELRITAGAVLEPTRVQFDVVVDLAM